MFNFIIQVNSGVIQLLDLLCVIMSLQSTFFNIFYDPFSRILSFFILLESRDSAPDSPIFNQFER